MTSSRIGEVTGIIENIKNVISIVWTVSWKQWFHLGEHLFATCTLMVIIGVALLNVGIYEEISIWKRIVPMAYIILGTVFTAFFPKISGIGDIVAPRTLYPYGCLPGIVAIYAIISLGNNVKKRNIVVFGFVLTIVLGMQYLNFSSVIIERYRANQNDKYYCEIIGEKIKEYEEESGNAVDTICFYYDKSVKWYDSGCDETTQSPRAQSCGWSNVTALNMYLDKKYVKGEPCSEYIEYFERYNWDTYSDKQIIFEENVLHLCIY